MVRVTTRLRCRGSSSSALRLPAAAELAVRLVDDDDARRPAAASQSAVDRLERQRGAGRVVRARQQHHARLPLLDQVVRVVEVEGEVALAVPDDPLGDGVAGVLGYIEYVGAKLSATRPGPPKACSSWSITSLEPLAAQTCSGGDAVPPRYAASAVRSSVNSRSG